MTAPATRERRCDFTDLPESSCAHCTGRLGDPTVPADHGAPGWGPWFAAAYPGRCSACGHVIAEGDRIRAGGDSGYLCRSCGRGGRR